MLEKVSGMEIKKNLDDAVREPVQLTTDSFSVSWLGNASTSNTTFVETIYSGDQLGAQVVVTGTPTWDVACVITFTPVNCQLKSGQSKVDIVVNGGNLGVTFLTTITPTDAYKGKTVQFRVTIEGSRGAVLYARGSIG